jgi:glycosyltransferase involved in cell wall biosynthesis
MCVGRTLSSLPALVRYLRTSQPRAMLSALNRANIVAVWARRAARISTRIAVSERNNLSVGSRQMPGWLAWSTLKLVQASYPWADDIIAVSKGIADDLSMLAGIPRERIRVVYNPVVTPELRLKAQVPLEHPWFEPNGTPVVLGVGRLAPQKDFSTLLHAFARVRETRPARLLILGEGEERCALEALIEKLDLEQDVSLPGWVKNPYPYMKRASAFVLSSKWEGLPGVLIEAMYCGVPLISTDCPSGPREVLRDGQYGQLVPVGDVDALASAIKMVLDGKVPSPPSESWDRFEKETVVNRYLDVLVGS